MTAFQPDFQGRVLTFGRGELLVFGVLNPDASVTVFLQPGRGHLAADVAAQLARANAEGQPLASKPLEVPDQVVLHFLTLDASLPLLDAIQACAADLDAQLERIP